MITAVLSLVRGRVEPKWITIEIVNMITCLKKDSAVVEIVGEVTVRVAHIDNNGNLNAGSNTWLQDNIITLRRECKLLLAY